MTFDHFSHLHSYSDIDYSVAVYSVQHIKPSGNWKFYLFTSQKTHQWSMFSAALLHILQLKNWLTFSKIWNLSELALCDLDWGKASVHIFFNKGDDFIIAAIHYLFI